MRTATCTKQTGGTNVFVYKTSYRAASSTSAAQGVPPRQARSSWPPFLQHNNMQTSTAYRAPFRAHGMLECRCTQGLHLCGIQGTAPVHKIGLVPQEVRPQSFDINGAPNVPYSAGVAIPARTSRQGRACTTDALNLQTWACTCAAVR